MIVISPELKRIKVANRKVFATVSGLSQDSIQSLATGRRACIKGWLSTHKSKRSSVKRIIAKYTLVNVDTGEVAYTWPDIKTFAKNRELSYPMLFRLINGEVQRYRSWVRKDTYNLLYNNTLHKVF